MRVKDLVLNVQYSIISIPRNLLKMKAGIQRWVYTIYVERLYASSLLGISFLWLRSGVLKLLSGDFPQTLGGTLSFFAEKNPYPWFQTILYSYSIPNSLVFGYAVMFGEVFSGIVIGLVSILALYKRGLLSKGLSSLLLLGLVTGASLNLVFWLASGYLSPSGDGLNLLMLFIQLVGIVSITRTLRRR